MTKAKAIAKNNPVDTATMEKFSEIEQANANNRRFDVVIYYSTNRDGVTFKGMDSTRTATATEAAQQIITFASNHPEYSITEFTIRDSKAYKTYCSTEADLAALKGEEEETFAAVIPTEDNDYDETDEPEILNADLFVNLYHSPMQERYASVTRSINGEQLYFFHHRLTNISAPALNLEVYFDNGRMNFWHGNKRIARDKVWQVPIIKETAKAQTESFGKFFAGDHTPKFFKVSVYPTFADGNEHNYVRYFDFFNQAQKFVEEVKIFVGDVPNQIYITGGGQYLYTRINGIENYTLPAVDAAQAQSRLDELNKAIADNESFADKCDDDLTASKLRVANSRLKRSIAYYEAALRMTEPASEETRPAFEDGKVYVLHARDIIGKPDPQLYKVKRIKMFGKKFLAIVPYIKYMKDFDSNAERYQIYTDDEGEYIQGVYSTDGCHCLYAKDITDDPTIVKPVDTQTNQPTDFTTKLAELKAKADAAKKTAEEAKAELVKAQKAHAEAVNAADRAALDYDYFGCDIAAALTAHNLPYCELDVKTQTGFSWIIHTDAIKVSFDEDKFKLHCNTSEGDFRLGEYDTPEEVTDVIERLKAAIARGDKEFSFAHEDEPINQPDNSTPDKLRDSLARGMKECLIKTQEHLCANDLKAALVENERYQICANALHDVKEMIA